MSDQYQSEGKSSWPELLGAQGTDAKATIESENASVTAVIVLEGTAVTKDFRLDRVRVWVNTDGIVTSIPKIGQIPYANDPRNSSFAQVETDDKPSSITKHDSDSVNVQPAL
ncbi:hypothetical protein ACLB2K_038503 [Fragaria x ananassa]